MSCPDFASSSSSCASRGSERNCISASPAATAARSCSLSPRGPTGTAGAVVAGCPTGLVAGATTAGGAIIGAGGGVLDMPANEAIMPNHISDIPVHALPSTPKQATTMLTTPIAVSTPGRELAAGAGYASAATGTGAIGGNDGAGGNAGCNAGSGIAGSDMRHTPTPRL